MDCISVGVLAMIILVSQPAHHDSIIGKWKAVGAPDHGYKIMEFADEGLLSVSWGVEGTLTYEVKGKFIHLNDPELGAEICDFRIENDTLFLKSPERDSKLRRLDKQTPDAPPIVGKWGETIISVDGQENSYSIEFTKNGRSTSTLEYLRGSGSYQISGDLLTI